MEVGTSEGGKEGELVEAGRDREEPEKTFKAVYSSRRKMMPTSS